jgi:tetratricopeptide (TPR) repeat protein
MFKLIKPVLRSSLVLYLAVAVIFFAVTDFKKAVVQRTRYLLGVFYNQELNNYTDGVVYFDYLAHLRPQDGRNYFFLGYCYLFLRQYDKALAYFEKASLLLPNDELTRQYIAHVRSKINKDAPEVPLPAGQIAIPLE